MRPKNFSPSYKKLDLSNLPNNHVWQLREAGKTTTTQTALLVKTGAQCERFWFGSAAGEAESWNAELRASAHGSTKPHAALWGTLAFSNKSYPRVWSSSPSFSPLEIGYHSSFPLRMTCYDWKGMNGCYLASQTLRYASAGCAAPR